eukprot:PhM_4_TR5663/c1_g1_i1/m.69741
MAWHTCSRCHFDYFGSFCSRCAESNMVRGGGKLCDVIRASNFSPPRTTKPYTPHFQQQHSTNTHNVYSGLSTTPPRRYQQERLVGVAPTPPPVLSGATVTTTTPVVGPTPSKQSYGSYVHSPIHTSPRYGGSVHGHRLQGATSPPKGRPVSPRMPDTPSSIESYLRVRVKEKENEVTDLYATTRTLRQEIEQLRHECWTARKDAERWKASAEELDAKLDELREVATTLVEGSEPSSVASHEEQLRSRLMQQDTEIDMLRTELSKLRMRTAEISDDHTVKLRKRDDA